MIEVVANTEEIAESWSNYFEAQRLNKYQVIAGPAMEEFAKNIVSIDPKRFLYHESKWEKFSDGTDNIHLGGFRPVNRIAGQNVLLIASFYNNDVTLSLFSAMVALLQSFVESLTVVLPFYPVGTMERVLEEGQLATANTYAQMFSNLPSCGKPTRLIVYDIHTLQNRFYLHGNAVASLQVIHICIFLYAYICIYKVIHMYMYICICIYIYISIYLYIYIHIYVYMYAHIL
jgi:phosphoribosylpyrophosphate synthetase